MVRFSSILEPSLAACVDWRTTHLTVVLNANDTNDAAFAVWLRNRLAYAGDNMSIKFAELAPPAVLASAPNARDGSRYAGPGYTQQLFDTLLLDTWMPPTARPNDLIGILDCDSPLLTMLAPRQLLDASGKRIRRVVLSSDVYSGDALLPTAITKYNAMSTEAMPQVHWVGTMAATRKEIARRGGSLAAAWVQCLAPPA